VQDGLGVWSSTPPTAKIFSLLRVQIGCGPHPWVPGLITQVKRPEREAHDRNQENVDV
jgi:hypothetical protein